MMSEQEYLVTINIPPSLEDHVIDCLLTLEAERGFSSFAVDMHHHLNRGLTIAEQVTGRQKALRLQVYVTEQGRLQLLSKLREEFAGAGLYYWIIPVVEHGVV